MGARLPKVRLPIIYTNQYTPSPVRECSRLARLLADICRVCSFYYSISMLFFIALVSAASQFHRVGKSWADQLCDCSTWAEVSSSIKARLRSGPIFNQLTRYTWQRQFDHGKYSPGSLLVVLKATTSESVTIRRRNGSTARIVASNAVHCPSMHEMHIYRTRTAVMQGKPRCCDAPPPSYGNLAATDCCGRLVGRICNSDVL